MSDQVGNLRTDVDRRLLPVWSTMGLFLAIQIVDQLLSRRVTLTVVADDPARQDAIDLLERLTDVAFIAVAVAVVVAALARLRPTWMNRILIAYLVLATANLMLNVVTMIATAQFEPAEQLHLMWDVALVYANTVLVFAVWYRLLDTELEHGAFEFPEDPKRPDRVPGWIEYIFLSFNTNATFGPTVETVHSRIAKVMMMLQTSMSLLILVVLVARIVGLGN
ncbi:MAG: hypothetical protein ACOYML_00480 [Microthrixaceae bacterium]